MGALSPRVYVACLGCYNAGSHHGTWAEANDELPGNVAEYFGGLVCVHCSSPLHYVPAEGNERHVYDDRDRDSGDDRHLHSIAGPRCEETGSDEFIVHDYEGFGALKIGECSVEEAARVGQWLIDMDDQAEVAAALHDHLNNDDFQATADMLEDAYAGSFDSLEDWAQDFHEQCGTDLGPLKQYIDWERVARDAELGGDVFTVKAEPGKVHVFWNR